MATIPATRDLLVQVDEAKTASFNVGAGINSNGGVGGNLTFEQKNFDIKDVPQSLGDIFTDRAFIGAGQDFRASLEPGTQQTNASLRFTEPYILDQPFSLTTEAYYRDRVRENYDDDRLGGRVSLGHRFDYVYSGVLTLRGEDVNIRNITDKEVRAQEIIDAVRPQPADERRRGISSRHDQPRPAAGQGHDHHPRISNHSGCSAAITVFKK